MGQLQLYQWALEEQEPERQLFLAISQAIYTRHFQKPIAILNQLKESRRYCVTQQKAIADSRTCSGSDLD
jgi:hypothetical protein